MFGRLKKLSRLKGKSDCDIHNNKLWMAIGYRIAHRSIAKRFGRLTEYPYNNTQNCKYYHMFI